MSFTESARPLSVLDTTIGASAVAVGVVSAGSRRTVAIASPLLDSVIRPSSVFRQQHHATWLDELAARGAERRVAGQVRLIRYLERVVPALAVGLLRRLDVPETLRQSVDVNAIVADVDFDAVVDQLDLTTIVCERIDLDVVTAEILKRIDLTNMIIEVLEQIDLPAIVRASNASTVADTMAIARARRPQADGVVARRVQALRHGRAHRSK
ncbi:MAG: hypothetical protein ACRDO2_04375 [Nocardioidaceae bacterium]